MMNNKQRKLSQTKEFCKEWFVHLSLSLTHLLSFPRKNDKSVKFFMSTFWSIGGGGGQVVPRLRFERKELYWHKVQIR